MTGWGNYNRRREWYLYDDEGKLIDTFRTKAAANRFKKKDWKVLHWKEVEKGK